MGDVEVNFKPLGHLLKAGSKDQVQRLCSQAFMYRDTTSPPQEILVKETKNLGIEANDAVLLFQSLACLIRAVLFQVCTDVASVAAVFPENFHKNLKDLLSKIIAENLSDWRSRMIGSQISLPKLVDFDWRVDTKCSSDSLSRMSVPTCILQLQIEDNSSDSENLTGSQSLSVELSKEKLEAMLDGLGKIRDQLSSVAKKK